VNATYRDLDIIIIVDEVSTVSELLLDKIGKSMVMAVTRHLDRETGEIKPIIGLRLQDKIPISIELYRRATAQFILDHCPGLLQRWRKHSVQGKVFRFRSLNGDELSFCPVERKRNGFFVSEIPNDLRVNGSPLVNIHMDKLLTAIPFIDGLQIEQARLAILGQAETVTDAARDRASLADKLIQTLVSLDNAIASGGVRRDLLPSNHVLRMLLTDKARTGPPRTAGSPAPRDLS
jgi:hypothetical protein